MNLMRQFKHTSYRWRSWIQLSERGPHVLYRMMRSIAELPNRTSKAAARAYGSNQLMSRTSALWVLLALSAG